MTVVVGERKEPKEMISLAVIYQELLPSMTWRLSCNSLTYVLEEPKCSYHSCELEGSSLAAHFGSLSFFEGCSLDGPPGTTLEKG